GGDLTEDGGVPAVTTAGHRHCLDRRPVRGQELRQRLGGAVDADLSQLGELDTSMSDEANGAVQAERFPASVLSFEAGVADRAALAGAVAGVDPVLPRPISILE